MTRASAAIAFGRHRVRTTLAVIGVAVAGALLLDMVMLAGGMRTSFRTLLLVRGYQLRVTPKGTPSAMRASPHPGGCTSVGSQQRFPIDPG